MMTAQGASDRRSPFDDKLAVRPVPGRLAEIDWGLGPRRVNPDPAKAGGLICGPSIVLGREVGEQMIRPWSEIREFYAKLNSSGLSIGAMQRLVDQIEGSQYANGIHGWTSMHDLAITQSPTWTFRHVQPYLRISPKFNGTLEFRYFDTPVAARQWSRIVDENLAFARLEKFFDQLNWFGRIE